MTDKPVVNKNHGCGSAPSLNRGHDMPRGGNCANTEGDHVVGMQRGMRLAEAFSQMQRDLAGFSQPVGASDATSEMRR